MTIKIQKTILLFLVLINATVCFSQDAPKSDIPKNLLKGTRWKVDSVPFETTDRESYVFTEIPETDLEIAGVILFLLERRLF